MKGKLIYKETQTFRGTLVWWLILVVSLPIVGMFLWAFYQQLILGESWGTKPMSDMGLVVVGSLSLTVVGSVFALFHTMKLIVEIDEGALYYSFFPFVRTKHTVSKTQVENLQVRESNPILEFGGWGYRIGFFTSRAYNVKGKWGLQLVFTDGEKLFLGTQKPKELEQAIHTLKASWGMTN